MYNLLSIKLNLLSITRSLGLILGFLFLSSCSNLFYFPDHYTYRTPDQFNLNYESFTFPSSDGTSLNGWKIQRRHSERKSLGTILHFHGNAQNLSSHFMMLAWLAEVDYDLMIFDYRGYGQSGGSPSQDGIYLDSLAAMKKGYEYSLENKSPFIVYGQSLGGNVAMRALVDFEFKDQVKLLVLDSTFMSYQKMAWDKMTSAWILIPFSPLAFIFFSDRYASDLVIDRLPKIPVLVIHGTNDQVVPYKFGKKIYDRLNNEKWLWTVQDGYHTDGFFRPDHNYREDFLSFLKDRAIQNAWYQ
ncbi:MAG: alpha/beta hydrolase [Bacteriovoracaceae bacterium]